MLLAACSDPDALVANRQSRVDAAGPPRAEARAERIACARGAAPLRSGCTVERSVAGGTLILTVRYDGDGGFRRLQVTNDGRGVVAADGAEPARVATVGPDAIDVAIGTDRYRLPATIGARP